jgi:membrane-associated phospholipid phosphatase
MYQLKDALRYKRAKFFNVCFLMAIVCSFILTMLVGEQHFVELLKVKASFLLNVCLINITFLGDGFFAALLVISIGLFSVDNRVAKVFAVSSLGTLVFVQLFKNILSHQDITLFFEPGQTMFSLDNLYSAKVDMFISSHSALVCALATVAVAFLRNKYLHVAAIVLVVLVAYSRIYLTQSMPSSILLGALVGFAVAKLTVYYFANRTKIKRQSKRLKRQSGISGWQTNPNHGAVVYQ